jgi:hypothetical protein
MVEQFVVKWQMEVQCSFLLNVDQRHARYVNGKQQLFKGRSEIIVVSIHYQTVRRKYWQRHSNVRKYTL